MPVPPHGVPSASDKAAILAFWRFYEPRRGAPSLEDEETHALQADAIVHDRWAPYLASLHARGTQAAEAGVTYAAWLEQIRAYRDGVRDHLSGLLQEDPERNVSMVLAVSRGMNAWIDVIVERVGEAYLAAKTRIAARTEERYRVMFESSPLPMWMYDRETLAFVAVNEAAIRHYGYTRDELAAMTISDIRPAEDVPALKEDLLHARGLSGAQTWRHRKKDGELITVEIRASDLVIADKDVRLVLVNDVTDRVRAEAALKKTEEQLRHAQKMDALGRLAGSVAHDFNNVLTVVQSYASMLEDSLDASDQRREDASEIRRAGERAAKITRQLLTLSRHGNAAPRSIDLDELVAAFLPILRRLVGETVGIVVLPGKVPKVIADPGQVEQVLMNLAVNARDAMSDGGRLTIESRALDVDTDSAAAHGLLRPGRYVELALTDTGVGMDARIRGQIFEPFFTTKEAGKGTGLGLSIVHGIVSQAGGAISVYSEPGHGTTFRVLLPVGDGVALATDGAELVAPATLPAVRVLVVDDQPEVRAVAARILQDAGCQVLEAATGEEARRICVSHEDAIALVLLDVMLPDEHGNGLVRQLQELRPATRIVQMSGYPVGALTEHGVPPEHLLTKPFSPSELRAAVARACGVGAAPAAPGALAASERARRRVLLADDDDGLRRALKRLLQASDFDVVDVDGGHKASAALQTESFDVVVTDVQMPGGGGLDLLRAVRRVDLDVPVIIVTGEPSVAAAAAAVEYGAFRYLTKPLDGADFARIVGQAARAHALARLRRDAYGMTGAHAGTADRAGLEVRFEQSLSVIWMAFQPIVHATSGVLFGVEALLRSDEPSMPNPAALLDAASELGRLPLIGRKVRALSTAALARRSDAVALFVNLHPDDLRDADLLDASAPLSQIAPRVILEVTERAALDISPEVSSRIARLRELGFRLAVDDIGAGYSGLASFTELAPEVVKVDMSLVRDVHKSALKQRTIGALCRLCHEVETLVVAEGVETAEERDTLVALGCDLLQGYFFGRPSRA